MPAKVALLALALAVTAGGAAAQPDPKKPDDKKLVTKVYTVKPLIGDRGKASDVPDVDAVVKLIFEAIPQFRELKPGPDGPQIVERDDGKLEVRATAELQEQVKDLLDALARLQDIAVDVKAEVIELDAAGYEKLVKALPKGKAKAPVLFATGEEIEGKEGPAIDKALGEANKILKTGRVVQASGGRFVNGVEATVSARQLVVTFHNHVVNGKPPAEVPQFVKDGFKLVGLPVASRDRRFVRLKLTEQSTVISGLRKRDFGEVAGEKFVLQTLDTEDLGATGSALIADGGTLIFKLAYAPKDKVWVVVLRLTIFIQAEEDELKKEGKPAKP